MILQCKPVERWANLVPPGYITNWELLLVSKKFRISSKDSLSISSVILNFSAGDRASGCNSARSGNMCGQVSHRRKADRGANHQKSRDQHQVADSQDGGHKPSLMSVAARSWGRPYPLRECLYTSDIRGKDLRSKETI
jgi:hypothetical protein